MASHLHPKQALAAFEAAVKVPSLRSASQRGAPLKLGQFANQSVLLEPLSQCLGNAIPAGSPSPPAAAAAFNLTTLKASCETHSDLVCEADQLRLFLPSPPPHLLVELGETLVHQSPCHRLDKETSPVYVLVSLWLALVLTKSFFVGSFCASLLAVMEQILMFVLLVS